MLPAPLVQEVGELRVRGLDLELVDADGWANVLLRGYRIPAGYSKPRTDLLVRCPPAFPQGAPDMFWTDIDLLLAGGGIPRNADVIEVALGRSWRRFSWHPQRWTPGVDCLASYLEFVDSRFARAV